MFRIFIAYLILLSIGCVRVNIQAYRQYPETKHATALFPDKGEIVPQACNAELIGKATMSYANIRTWGSAVRAVCAEATEIGGDVVVYTGSDTQFSGYHIGIITGQYGSSGYATPVYNTTHAFDILHCHFPWREDRPNEAKAP